MEKFLQLDFAGVYYTYPTMQSDHPVTLFVACSYGEGLKTSKITATHYEEGRKRTNEINYQH